MTIVMIGLIIGMVACMAIILYSDNKDMKIRADLAKALVDSEAMKKEYEMKLKELELELARINKNKDNK